MSLEERAQAVLAALRRVVPFAAGWIGLLDPEYRQHVPLVVQGYDDRSRDYITTPAIVEDIELLGLDRPGRPLRLRDSPIPLEEVRGWAEYLAPAGFREALAVPLFALDGRHLGLLAVHTDTPAHPTDAARDLIATLAPTLGHALDPMRFIMAGARLVRGATAGVVLARAGRPLPLPGLPADPLLAAGSAVLAEVARQLADGGGWTQFLWPAPGPGSAAGHVRIAALGCAALPPHHLAAAVVVAPPPHLHGLTPLQLQILGLLVEDWTNDRIAVALGVTPRAVAGHLQRIRAALGAATRDVVTLRARSVSSSQGRPTLRSRAETDEQVVPVSTGAARRRGTTRARPAPASLGVDQHAGEEVG